jgi:hypothetical protein
MDRVAGATGVVGDGVGDGVGVVLDDGVEFDPVPEVNGVDGAGGVVGVGSAVVTGTSGLGAGTVAGGVGGTTTGGVTGFAALGTYEMKTGKAPIVIVGVSRDSNVSISNRVVRRMVWPPYPRLTT